jgi:hypothetical protein
MPQPTPRCRLEISIDRYHAAQAWWPRVFEDFVVGSPTRLVARLRSLADEIEAGLLTKEADEDREH